MIEVVLPWSKRLPMIQALAIVEVAVVSSNDRSGTAMVNALAM